MKEVTEETVATQHFTLESRTGIVTTSMVRGTIYDSINGPGGPFMSSYLVWLKHLCIDINGLGET